MRFELTALDSLTRVTISGVIGKESMKPDELKTALYGVGDIDLRIDSKGGDIDEGLEIYEILKAHAGKITATVDSLAASMGSIILMAADKIIIPENHHVMIHNPAAMPTKPMEAHELEVIVEAVKDRKERMIAIYHERTKLAKNKLSKMMDKTTWMNGFDAVKNGFADKTTPHAAVQACIFEGVYKGVPDDLILTNKEGDDMPDDLQKQLDDLTAKFETVTADNVKLKADLTALQAEKDKAEHEARDVEIKALFKATGKEYNEANAKPYFSMSAEVFAVASTDMMAMVKAAPDSLFTAQATSGKETTTIDPLQAALDKRQGGKK